MVVGEYSGDEDHGREDDTKVEVVIWRLLKGRSLNAVGEEAKDGSEPEEESEATKEILAELDPLRGLGRGSQSVGSISLLVGFHLSVGQSRVGVRSQPLAELADGNFVEVDVELLLQLVQILLLRLGWNNFLLNLLNQQDLL